MWLIDVMHRTRPRRVEWAREVTCVKAIGWKALSPGWQRLARFLLGVPQIDQPPPTTVSPALSLMGYHHQD